MGGLDGEQKQLIKKLVNFRMKEGKRTRGGRKLSPASSMLILRRRSSCPLCLEEPETCVKHIVVCSFILSSVGTCGVPPHRLAIRWGHCFSGRDGGQFHTSTTGLRWFHCLTQVDLPFQGWKQTKPCNGGEEFRRSKRLVLFRVFGNRSRRLLLCFFTSLLLHFLATRLVNGILLFSESLAITISAIPSDSPTEEMAIPRNIDRG